MSIKNKITLLIGILFVFALFNLCYGYWDWPVEGDAVLNIHGTFTSEFGPNNPGG